MLKSIVSPRPRRICRWALLPCPDLECRLPLPVLNSLLADRLAYRKLLEEHLKALAVLAIHAPADAGAREILETSEFVGGGR